jgi:hypothetical protein
MYRVSYKTALCLFFSLTVVGLAQPASTTSVPTVKKTKVRRACNSLRILAKKHVALRPRAKAALLKKRDAEKLCREAFRSELPGMQIELVGGSTCRALAQHQPKTEQITSYLKRAGQLNRRADMRCARLLKRLHAPKTRRKLGGNQ